MSSKTMVLFGMSIGSFIGGYIPTLFGQDMFSLTSIIAGGVGGLLGIWLTLKIVDW